MNTTFNTDPYSEPNRGVFARLNYGAAPSKVLDFFIENKDDTYTQSEISEDTKLSNKTVSLAIKHLEQRGLVKIARKVGQARLLKFNSDSEAATLLMEAAFALAKIENRSSITATTTGNKAKITIKMKKEQAKEKNLVN